MQGLLYYRELLKTVEIDIKKCQGITLICDKINRNKPRYDVIEKATGVPAYAIACIHLMECGLDFNKHLHNGDPLASKTVNVPKDRPEGTPPFAWEESARDAILYTKLNNKIWYPMECCLFNLECYNGTGYAKKGINSPYLWAGTNHYTKGKYTADGKFDYNAVSKQIGCVAILKTLGVI